MSHWDEIRRRARTQRAAALREAGGEPSAESLLAVAERLTGFERIGLPAGDSLLDDAEATLDHGMKMVWFNRLASIRLTSMHTSGCTLNARTRQSSTWILRPLRNPCQLA